MSLWTADVGEVIIKPEYRMDFGYLFRGEYEEIECELLSAYVEEYGDYLTPMERWSHMDYKPEWKGKYITSYNKETGVSVYGCARNMHGMIGTFMHEFHSDILPAITETVISYDGWIEDT